MGQPILFGFSAALAGLVIGLVIGWFVNAYSGATAVVPGKVGMVVAGVFGLVLNGILTAMALRASGPLGILEPMLLGTTSGMLIPIAVGNILRLHFIEKMADDTGMHSWKWGRLLVGCFILFVTMKTIADAPDFSPTATPAENIDAMIGSIAAWALLAGCGLWLIRSGTKRPSADFPFSGA
jgi:hypothetical protein